jgi:hypothetical protein
MSAIETLQHPRFLYETPNGHVAMHSAILEIVERLEALEKKLKEAMTIHTYEKLKVNND